MWIEEVGKGVYGVLGRWSRVHGICGEEGGEGVGILLVMILYSDLIFEFF